MSDSWLWMTAADLGRGIARGRDRPARAAEVYLAAIDSHPQAPAIYARTTPERARAEADAAAGRARAGLRRGPLDGVPVSWKDLFDTAGIATEAGSALLAGRVPERDAAVLATATRAGLVCLGKTHLTELAFSVLGRQPGHRHAAQHQRPRARARRLVVGRRRLGRLRPRRGGDRLGHRRLGAGAGGLERPRRAEDHARRCCRSTASCRSPRASTPSARSAARSRTRPCCSPRWPAQPRPTSTGAGLDGVRLLALDAPDVLPDPRCARARPSRRRSHGSTAAGARVERGAPPAVAETLALATRASRRPRPTAIWRDAIEARPEVMFAPVRDRFRAGAGIAAADDYVAAWQRARRACAPPGTRPPRASMRCILPTTAEPAARSRPPASPTPTSSPTENLLALRNPNLANLLGLCAMTLPGRHPRLRADARWPLRAARPRLLRLGRRGGAGACIVHRKILDPEGLAG